MALEVSLGVSRSGLPGGVLAGSVVYGHA